jgi:hypothetical protein
MERFNGHVRPPPTDPHRNDYFACGLAKILGGENWVILRQFAATALKRNEICDPLSVSMLSGCQRIISACWEVQFFHSSRKIGLLSAGTYPGCRGTGFAAIAASKQAGQGSGAGSWFSSSVAAVGAGVL